MCVTVIQASKKSSFKKSILIVDDNTDFISMLKLILEVNNFDVRTSLDGLQALESAKFLKPDLIISDILMPNLDGYQLFYQIKSSPKLRDVPIIFLSGENPSEEFLKNHSEIKFLKKPVSSENLLDIINLNF